MTKSSLNEQKIREILDNLVDEIIWIMNDSKDEDIMQTVEDECIAAIMEVMEGKKSNFNKLYGIIDVWYHEQTRHHLVDLDPDVKTNLFDKLLKDNLNTGGTT
jgi:hypothetical protein